jgi:hypothetical protein
MENLPKNLRTFSPLLQFPGFAFDRERYEMMPFFLWLFEIGSICREFLLRIVSLKKNDLGMINPTNTY